MHKILIIATKNLTREVLNWGFDMDEELIKKYQKISNKFNKIADDIKQGKTEIENSENSKKNYY